MDTEKPALTVNVSLRITMNAEQLEAWITDNDVGSTPREVRADVREFVLSTMQTGMWEVEHVKR
jgi:hypothetical protein